jgi:hypothetical protein
MLSSNDFTNLICENLCVLRYLRAFDTTTPGEVPAISNTLYESLYL